MSASVDVGEFVRVEDRDDLPRRRRLQCLGGADRQIPRGTGLGDARGAVAPQRAGHRVLDQDPAQFRRGSEVPESWYAILFGPTTR